jgi:hypothetical protein
MIDNLLKPWLIEVNSSPSLSASTSFDRALKMKVSAYEPSISMISFNNLPVIALMQSMQVIADALEIAVPEKPPQSSNSCLARPGTPRRAMRSIGKSTAVQCKALHHRIYASYPVPCRFDAWRTP